MTVEVDKHQLTHRLVQRLIGKISSLDVGVEGGVSVTCVCVCMCVHMFSPLVTSSEWMEIEATPPIWPLDASKFISFDIDEVQYYQQYSNIK